MDPENEVVDDLQPLDGALGEAFGSADADEGGDEDMLAGYVAAGGGVDGAQPAPAAAAVDDDTVVTPPAVKQAAPAAAPQPTPEPVKIGGRWTVDEVESRFAELDQLKKGQSSVAGHIGDIRQRLQAAPRKVTAADFAGIAEEFGADYATALAEDLNKIGGLGGSAGPTQAEIDNLVEARSQQHAVLLERKLEAKAVKRAHKDADDHFSILAPDGKTWNHGPKAAEFRAFVATLPPERKTLVENSWDSDVMIEAISDFKKHQTASAPAASPAPTPAPRTNRLSRAVAPQGTGGAGPGEPTEDDAMAAGYNLAKGKR